MRKYRMLLGEPCRCYYKDNKGVYNFVGIGYYVGNGYCVMHNFTDIKDMLFNGDDIAVIHYDRYIPTRLWNNEYQYAKERGILHKLHWNLREILLPNYKVEDFNTEMLEDFYQGHLNMFWWWHEIQNRVLKEIEYLTQK